MRWYLSGPVSGYPDNNREQFTRVAHQLRECGYDIVSPLEFGEIPGLSWASYLREDIKVLMTCDGVVTLPGWQESRGATLEVHIAHALGMQVLPLAAALAARSTVTTKTRDCACVSRDARECADQRYDRRYDDFDGNDEYDERCECVCHVEQNDESVMPA